MRQTISIPENYVKKLKGEKKETGRTMSEVIRRALDMYFDKKEV